MLFIHPIIQLFSLLLGAYTLYLGLQRTLSLHFSMKVPFHWRRHVIIGTMALLMLAAGMAGGMGIVYGYWRGFLITGAHGRIALAAIPFILLGLGTGVYMSRVKKGRRVLPLIHGINNLILMILGIAQIVTGWSVYVNFVR